MPQQAAVREKREMDSVRESEVDVIAVAVAQPLGAVRADIYRFAETVDDTRSLAPRRHQHAQLSLTCLAAAWSPSLVCALGITFTTTETGHSPQSAQPTSAAATAAEKHWPSPIPIPSR